MRSNTSVMRTHHILFTFVTSLFIPACQATHVKGSGDVVKRSITVAAFHGIEVEGSMDVVLTQGATQSVVVEAQANLIDLLELDVSKGVWSIETKEDYSTDKPFIVHITAPVIDKVEVDGSGDVTCNGVFKSAAMDLSVEGSGNITMNFQSEKASAAVAGSGDMTLTGTCTKLSVSVAGSGDVNAKALKAADASVDIAGSGDVTLDASQRLDVSIAGSGDVNYAGKPANINRNIVGSGEVRALDHGPR